MTRLIAIFSMFLPIALSAVAQEGKIIRFDKKHSGLPADFLEPVGLAYIYNRRYRSYYDTTIEEPFSVGLVDLNDDGVQEVAIRFEHEFRVIEEVVTILIAHRTPAGWRFIGEFDAPEYSLQESIPLNLAYSTQFYVEDKTVGGWRVINNGPSWKYNPEFGPIGGKRYCWASRAISPDQTGKHRRLGLPFDNGGPGYFNSVKATENCPEK